MDVAISPQLPMKTASHSNPLPVWGENVSAVTENEDHPVWWHLFLFVSLQIPGSIGSGARFAGMIDGGVLPFELTIGELYGFHGLGFITRTTAWHHRSDDDILHGVFHEGVLIPRRQAEFHFHFGNVFALGTLDVQIRCTAVNGFHCYERGEIGTTPGTPPVPLAPDVGCDTP